MQQAMSHSLQTSTLSDVLERVLDKGIVIAGDIKIKLVDIELLSLQIRLVICSVDKAKEMGMDWWANNPVFTSTPREPELDTAAVVRLDERLARLEAALAAQQAVTADAGSPVK
jgi:hypothetical protein